MWLQWLLDEGGERGTIVLHTIEDTIVRMVGTQLLLILVEFTAIFLMPCFHHFAE
jgi:hypothetical protein